MVEASKQALAHGPVPASQCDQQTSAGRCVQQLGHFVGSVEDTPVRPGPPCIRENVLRKFDAGSVRRRINVDVYFAN